jgi:phosphoesterase RecJ-like protein
MNLENPDWAQVVDALKGADSVAIACHVNPDGDALGSTLAASLGLQQLDKKTFVSWGDPPVTVPFSYAFLPGSETVIQPEDVPEADAFLALDCGAGDRLGTLEPVARKSEVVINIDHHPGNDMFGSLNVVEESASSTAEIVTHLLLDLGVDIDLDIATCLYTGIVTDTGRFQYSNSSPETLKLAAELLSVGVDAPAIAQEVFDSSPFGYLKLQGHVLERARLFEAERFVYSWITQQDLAETGVDLDETEKLVDAIRSVRDADVTAMFKQQEDGTYRVSLRSKGPSVGALARTRGGGGHELAAGFTASDVEGAVEGLLADLRALR